MQDKPAFIKSATNILSNDLSIESIFNIELSYMLEVPDYDAFITLYDISLNKKIRMDLLDLKENPVLIDLMHNIDIEKFQYDYHDSKQIDSIYNFFEENFRLLRVQWEDYANHLICKTQEFFHGKPKGIPNGLIECMRCIKNAAKYSASTNNAEITRIEEKISHMHYLISEANVNKELQQIQNYRKTSQDSTLFGKRESYLQNCKIANKFVEKNNIQLPFIYVLAYDIMKISQNPLLSIYEPFNAALVSDAKINILRLQNIYRNIMIAKPQLDKSLDYIISENQSDPNPKTSGINSILQLPFDLVLPSFIPLAGQKQYKSATSFKPSSSDNKHSESINVAHPFILTKLPCTRIPCSINDIEYFFKSFYKIAHTESSFSSDQMNNIQNKLLAPIANRNYGKAEEKKKRDKHIEIKLKITNLKESDNKARWDLYDRIEKKIDKININFDDFIKYFCKESTTYSSLEKFFEKRSLSKTNYQRYIQQDVSSRKREYILSVLVPLKYELDLSFIDFEFAFASAGYAFSDFNYRDVVIKEILQDQIDTVEDMNEVLQDLGLEPIQYHALKK